MTRERSSPAESKNCEILLPPTVDRRFDTKVKCPTRQASFWVKCPTVRSLTRVKCPGIARGGGDGRFWNWLVHYCLNYEWLETSYYFWGLEQTPTAINPHIHNRFYIKLQKFSHALYQTHEFIITQILWQGYGKIHDQYRTDALTTEVNLLRSLHCHTEPELRFLSNFAYCLVNIL